MRKLFDQFEELSVKAQELLEKGIGQMRDGFAPDPDLCQDITTALSSLRAAYDDIRRELPEHILAEELPEGDLPVRAYEEAWNNSVLSQKKAVRDVLEEFIRVYSDEKKYMDAIEVYIRDAKDLLSDMDSAEAQTQSPDVSTFQLFLDGVSADLSSDEELYDRLLDSSAFSPRIVKGLHDNKYYIRVAETSSDNQMDEETEELPPIVEPRNEHAEADAPAEIPASAEEPEAVPESGAEDNDGIETLTPEEFVEKYVNGVDASSEEATSPKENEQSTEDSEEDEEFLHPINPIKAAKLPSDQKLRELISRTGDVFRFLIDKLVFTGLMREHCVNNTAKKKKARL